MTHFKPWNGPFTACGTDTLAERTHTSRHLDKADCPDCRASTHATRERRCAEAEEFAAVEFGYWRTGGPEPLMLKTSAITDEHLEKILIHLRSHLAFYAFEGHPVPIPNMGEHAFDGWNDACTDWWFGNQTWQAMMTPRFASIIQEVLKRGWLEKLADLPEPDNGCTQDFLHVSGWGNSISQMYGESGFYQSVVTH